MKETIIKYIGFAEALFKGKNALPVVEKNDRQVSEEVRRRLFWHYMDTFNNGGYFANISNRDRK